MTHLSPQSSWRRQLDRLSGVGIVALGVLVAVLAVIALRQPGAHNADGPSAVQTRITKPPQIAEGAPPVTPTAVLSPADPLGTAGSSGTSASRSPTRTTSQIVSTASLRSVPLIVLNSTQITGLAHSAAQRFAAGGWTVTSEGNLVNNILSTCAYYDPANPADELAADQLRQQFPAIRRVEPKFDGLPAGPIVVVLTADYS